MTTYILAGGADRKHQEYGRALAAEVYKTVRRPAKILSCFFAVPREDWEKKFQDRRAWFLGIFGQDAGLELASPEDFSQQSRRADVIYLHGGDETLLGYYLDQIANLEGLWGQKVVVGTSAGAEYLAKSYWTCDWRKVRTGRGLVDVHVIPHFESEEYGVHDPRGPIDWQVARDELARTLSPAGTVTTLREGQFVTAKV